MTLGGCRAHALNFSGTLTTYPGGQEKTGRRTGWVGRDTLVTCPSMVVPVGRPQRLFNVGSRKITENYSVRDEGGRTRKKVKSCCRVLTTGGSPQPLWWSQKSQQVFAMYRGL